MASGFFFHFAPSSPCSLSALQTAVAIHSFGDCPHSAAQLYRTSTSLFRITTVASNRCAPFRSHIRPQDPQAPRSPSAVFVVFSAPAPQVHRPFPGALSAMLVILCGGSVHGLPRRLSSSFLCSGPAGSLPRVGGGFGSPFSNGPEKSVVYPAIYGSVPSVPGPAMSGCLNTVSSGSRSRATSFLGGMLAPIAPGFPAPFPRRSAPAGSRLFWVRLFFVGGPISLSGGGEAGGNWIRQGVVRSGRGSGGRRYFCRQRPMGDFRWSSRAS